MGIDIEVRGRMASRLHRGGPAAADAIDRFAQQWWAEDLLAADTIPHSAEAMVYLLTHPAAPPIEITIRRSAIEVAARTNTAGPGYHQRVCEFLHFLSGAAGIEWDSDPDQDETGYFTSGNREELEEAMLYWLSALCSACLANPPDSDGAIGLCMPMEPRFLYPAPIHTPSGPRTLEWMQEVAADRTSIAAREFFSSWLADRSPRELLARARAHMWMDLHWTPPQSERSEHAMIAAADLLAEAYRNDPDLDYPWAEWAEILHCLERDDDPMAATVHRQAEGLVPGIGYWRHPVIHHDPPGPWSITLPGRFEAQWQDETTWLAADGLDVLRFGSMELDAEGKPLDPLELLGDHASGARVLGRWNEDDHSGAAIVCRAEEDGDEFWMVVAMILRGSQAAQVTIVADDPDDPWVMESLRSARAAEEE